MRAMSFRDTAAAAAAAAAAADAAKVATRQQDNDTITEGSSCSGGLVA